MLRILFTLIVICSIELIIAFDLQNATFTFDCSDKPIGFYADVEFECQIFHMCDQQGHRIPHLCPNDTGFNQEYRICDWLFNFNCLDSTRWYYLNGLTYQPEE